MPDIDIRDQKSVQLGLPTLGAQRRVNQTGIEMLKKRYGVSDSEQKHQLMANRLSYLEKADYISNKKQL